MTFATTCVLIIPAALLAAANQVIEDYGFGPDNISVQLVKTADSSSWFGCQIWCNQPFVDYIQAHQAVDFLNTMVVSAVGGGSAYANWANTLAANGMTVAP